MSGNLGKLKDLAQPEEHLIPPLFDNADETPMQEAQPDPVPPGPQVLTTDTPTPETPVPTLEQQLPDLPAMRNRVSDMTQDINLTTARLSQMQGYQSPELAQACIRASEFVFWLDMALRKAEAEELAKAAGFDVQPKTN